MSVNLTRKEVQTYLGISYTSLQKLMQRDKDPIPYYRIGAKLLFPRQQVEEWNIRQAMMFSACSES